MKVRDATPDEAAKIFQTPPGYETWIGVLERGGITEGQICLTRRDGAIFGHDTEYRGTDKTGALKLWRAGNRKAKEWGARKVFIHIEPTTPARLLEFWKGRGARPSFLMYELELE